MNFLSNGGYVLGCSIAFGEERVNFHSVILNAVKDLLLLSFQLKKQILHCVQDDKCSVQDDKNTIP